MAVSVTGMVLAALLFFSYSQQTDNQNVPTGCKGALDVVFLVDSSESVREGNPFDESYDNWNLLRQFVADVISSLPLSGIGGTRVASIPFSSHASMLFNLNDHDTSVAASSKIRSLEFLGGNTLPHNAFHMARTNIFEAHELQPRRTLVFFSDGLSSSHTDEILREAEALKRMNVTILSVTAGEEVNPEVMASVSSGAEFYLQAPNFTHMSQTLRKLVYKLCGLEPPVNDCEVPNCLTCGAAPSTCVNCRGGTYLHAGTCKECLPNCEVCSSSVVCERCTIGWYWDSITRTCEKCEVKADLALLLDDSGSIRDKNPVNGSYDNYQIMKDFLKNLLGRLDVSVNKTRVAALRFSSKIHTEFYLDQYSSLPEMTAAVDDMGYSGGFTNTSGALRVMRTQLFDQNRGDRPDVRNVGIVVTDGESTFDQNLTIPEANLAKETGIQIFTVGITNKINQTELKLVASAPPSDHFFNSTEFYQLDSILTQVVKHVCSPLKNDSR